MRKVHLLAIVTLAFFMVHCATSKKTTNPGFYINTEKLNGRTFHKLFVEVQTVDATLRVRVETDLVEALTTAGFAGVKSIDLIPFSLKELKLPTEEEIKQKVKESGCDGILFVSVSHKGETVEYNSGTVRKENKQLGADVLSGVLNRPGDAQTLPSVNTQGSFTHTGAEFIFGNNLYDVPATELMFSVQSAPIDISSIEKTSKAYAADLVAQLKKEKLLK